MVLKLKFKYIIVCIIILVNHVFLIFFKGQTPVKRGLTPFAEVFRIFY